MTVKFNLFFSCIVSSISHFFYLYPGCVGKMEDNCAIKKDVTEVIFLHDYFTLLVFPFLG